MQRNYFIDIGVEGKMILKWIIVKYERRMWIGLMGSRRKSCGELL
jgi:hypothetical protein